MTDKILKKHVFVMRDFDGKDINELVLEMPSPCTFKEGKDAFIAFLVKHMDEPLSTLQSSAESILNEWHEQKKFPDGAFFFMKANNDSCFRVSYMYKKVT